MSKQQKEIAIAQFIGFAHASKGFGVKELADNMGLTKKEWSEIRGQVDLRASDKEDMNDWFKDKKL